MCNKYWRDLLINYFSSSYLFDFWFLYCSSCTFGYHVYPWNASIKCCWCVFSSEIFVSGSVGSRNTDECSSAKRKKPCFLWFYWRLESSCRSNSGCPASFDFLFAFWRLASTKRGKSTNITYLLSLILLPTGASSQPLEGSLSHIVYWLLFMFFLIVSIVAQATDYSKKRIKKSENEKLCFINLSSFVNGSTEKESSWYVELGGN